MSTNMLTFQPLLKHGRTQRSCRFHAKPSRPYLKESFNVEDADIVRIEQIQKYTSVQRNCKTTPLTCEPAASKHLETNPPIH